MSLSAGGEILKGDAMRHVDKTLLLCRLDDELDGRELLFVDAHLQQCEACWEEMLQMRRVSDGIDKALLSAPVCYTHTERDQLLQAMAERERILATPSVGGRKFGADGMRLLGAISAIAACLALGIYLQPVPNRSVAEGSTAKTGISNSFELDGEQFWALPYSNPDLPLSAAHVVQMEVPVSSLADAGIMVEPLMSRVAGPDRAVLADVLVGLDGQPLGVHVTDVD